MTRSYPGVLNAIRWGVACLAGMVHVGIAAAAPPPLTGKGAVTIELRGLVGSGVQTESELKKETRLGVRVEDVNTNGPASRAGLRAGDVILGANGYRVVGASEIRYVMPTPFHRTKKKVSLLANREGELISMDVEYRAGESLGYLAPDPALQVDAMLREASLALGPRERVLLSQMPERALVMIEEWQRIHPGGLKDAAWFADFCRQYLAVRLCDFEVARKPSAEAPIPFVRTLSALYRRIALDRLSGGDAADPAVLESPPRFLALYYPFPLPAAPPVDYWIGGLRTADTEFARLLRERIATPDQADAAAARYAERKASDTVAMQLDELKAACLAPARYAQLPHSSESICPDHHPETLARFRQWNPESDPAETSFMLAGRITAGMRHGGGWLVNGQMAAEMRAVSDNCPWLFRVLTGGCTYDTEFRSIGLIPNLPPNWAADLAQRDTFWRSMIHRSKGRIDCFSLWLVEPPPGVHRDAWALGLHFMHNPGEIEQFLGAGASGRSPPGVADSRVRASAIPEGQATNAASLAMLEDLLSSVPWTRERLAATARLGPEVILVASNSPAEKGGLRPGDILLGVAGCRVMGMEETLFARARFRSRPPDLLVNRGGMLTNLAMSVSGDAPLGILGPDPDEMARRLIGMSGFKPSAYERTVLRRLPTRAMLLVDRWSEAHPGGLTNAVWFQDFLRTAAAVRTPDPSAALRPVAPAPIPFINLLNELHRRTADLRVKGGAVLDAKLYQVPGNVLRLYFPYPLPPTTVEEMLGDFKTSDAEFLRLYRAFLADPQGSFEARLAAAQAYANRQESDSETTVINYLKATCLVPDRCGAFTFDRLGGLLAGQNMHKLEDFDPATTNHPEASLRLAAAVACWTWGTGKEALYDRQIRALAVRTPALCRLVIAFHKDLHGKAPLGLVEALGRKDRTWSDLLGRVQNRPGRAGAFPWFDYSRFDYFALFRHGEHLPGVDLDAWAIEQLLLRNPDLAKMVFLNFATIPEFAEKEIAL